MVAACDSAVFIENNTLLITLFDSFIASGHDGRVFCDRFWTHNCDLLGLGNMYYESTKLF